ncbi:5'-adenylylsulfate reductase-like 3 isoform X2 [Dioscorea cayenensis subsp. rotundata]|uniref:5'-adenylylsulfate reductase-like 3 isoform X2 n=1 Tax=Dioscorea cayennensis subsp. rotundata TaxID=55577 RepID=A0AB40BFE0_DIOCR|nr:5'-adenylylsulfate reductase-like 3 isoform X2 [Dioscorea cayenensis subsp. rotundata]
MAIRVEGVGVVLFLAFLVPAGGKELGLCLRVSALASFLGLHECLVSDSLLAGSVPPIGVLERMALNIVHKNKRKHVAVLFHASWCPFSKSFRPNFDAMSSMFPTIPHFAYEESVIPPSILSRYGVHGFPLLFLLNSTMGVRHHGSRAVSSLVTFYMDVTGIKPVSQLRVEKAEGQAHLTELKGAAEQENCPFSWIRSLEKLLEQDPYLALSSAFVLLRMLYVLLPRLNSCVMWAWGQRIRPASPLNTWDYFQASLLQAKQSFSKLIPFKQSDFQEGALHAKIWASKSLASVSFGDPSSSGRSPSTLDRR